VKVGKQHLFTPYRLDPVNEQVWHGETEILLRRKTFEVLRYLLEHPGQLVTKGALLDAVWSQVAVSDSMPGICVAELRKALGDDPDGTALYRDSAWPGLSFPCAGHNHHGIRLGAEHVVCCARAGADFGRPWGGA
jgi:hypothetical protein